MGRGSPKIQRVNRSRGKGKSCGACYRPYRGESRLALVIAQGKRAERKRICPSCAATAVLLVVGIGEIELEIIERLGREKKAVATAKRQERRRKKEESEAIRGLLDVGAQLAGGAS